MPEEYIEQNPFPEIPCPACGSLIPLSDIRNAEYPAADERSAPRCPAALKVSYRSFDSFITEYTKNVSSGGMFINTKRHHLAGDIVEVMLHVPGMAAPLRLECEVVRVNVRNVPDEEAGIGVRFLELEEESRRSLISYLTTLEECG